MKASQISDYQNVQIVGRERAQRGSSGNGNRKIVIIFLAVILIAAGVGGYFLFTANRLGGKSYHMLILDKASTTIKAQEISESISKAGGSGYIINDGEFKVSAALYKSLSDAEQVVERLKADYPNAYVATYTLKAKKTDKALKDALGYPVSLIDYVLEQSLSLDLAETTEGSILLAMGSRRAELNTHIKSLQTYLSDKPASAAAQKTHEFLTQINENWDYVGSLDTNLGVYNHRLKYFSCFLIEGYAALRNEI